MDTVHNAVTEPVPRLEVFTGAGRRRKWSDEDNARIVAEVVTSGDSVCSIGRRHGLSPQHLFGWRRQLREAVGDQFGTEKVQFVPAVTGLPQNQLMSGYSIAKSCIFNQEENTDARNPYQNPIGIRAR